MTNSDEMSEIALRDKQEVTAGQDDVLIIKK